MDAPGSRILLRPGGLGRGGGQLRRGVPGHGRLPGSGPLDDGAHLRPENQIEDTGGIRIVLAGFPPLALCVVTGDQLRRQDDGPPCGMHLRTEVPALWQSEDPVGGN